LGAGRIMRLCLPTALRIFCHHQFDRLRVTFVILRMSERRQLFRHCSAGSRTSNQLRLRDFGGGAELAWRVRHMKRRLSEIQDSNVADLSNLIFECRNAAITTAAANQLSPVLQLASGRTRTTASASSFTQLHLWFRRYDDRRLSANKLRWRHQLVPCRFLGDL
jgi:hypothetical protein